MERAKKEPPKRNGAEARVTRAESETTRPAEDSAEAESATRRVEKGGTEMEPDERRKGHQAGMPRDREKLRCGSKGPRGGISPKGSVRARRIGRPERDLSTRQSGFPRPRVH